MHWTPVAISHAKIDAALPSFILVVKADCLPQLSAPVLEGWLRGGRRTLVACGEAFPTGSLSEWLPLLDGRFTASTRLADMLDDVVQRHEEGRVRRHLALADWLPMTPTGPHAEYALRALAMLPLLRPVHDIEQWAAKCARSTSRHWSKLKSATGFAPRTLSLLYVEAYWRMARDSGDDSVTIATCLGYADFATLGHALVRARQHLAEGATKGADSSEPAPG